jgi:hypothetical protein
MSSRGFFDVMKDAFAEIAPGMKDIVPEVKAELSRLNTQGTMELASALFGNGAFVPYGPGQYTPTPEQAHDHSLPIEAMQKQPEVEQSRGIEM